MEVFNFNQRQHAEEKFWTALALARGYTAIGDKKNAIASWEVVLKSVPPNVSNRTAAFEQALKKLKERLRLLVSDFLRASASPWWVLVFRCPVIGS